MKRREEIAERISVLLNEEGGCNTIWARPAEVTHIPFMGSRENFFLLISICLKQESVDRKDLVSECLSAASLAIRSGLLCEEKAVEVSLYEEGPTRLYRVARLSILDVAFDQVPKIEASDLLVHPMEGVVCQWPLK